MHPWLYHGDRLELPTYLTCLMVGFSLATAVLRREALRSALPVRTIMDLALLTVPSVLVGARLGHVLLVAPRFYWNDPLATLNFAFGGFVFYGGLLAGGLVLLGQCRRRGLPPFAVTDVFAPATAFGLVFGRLGCLGGGCCYGKPISWPTGVEWPWGLRYFHRGQVPDASLATSLHPTPLYEAAFALALFVALSRLRERPDTRPGEATLAFVGVYGVGRSVVEVFRADTERGLYFGGWCSTSQLVGLASAAVAFLWWARLRRS